MAILNRDMDPSEQKELFRFAGSTQITTGNTQWIGIVPYPCTVQSARSVAVGVSGAPIINFQVQRFAPGNTVIALGISGMLLNNFGTSGCLGYSGLAAPGATVLNLQLGDIVMFEMSGSNSAALQLALELVVKKTQDIVSYNGVSI